MFNLYKIQLKEKCKELYEENLKLKEELKKYKGDDEPQPDADASVQDKNNIKLELKD